MEIENMPEITKMDIRTKIKFVEELWDNILADEEEIPVPPSHIQELNRRKSTMRKDQLLSFDELKSSIEKHLWNIVSFFIPISKEICSIFNIGIKKRILG